MALENARSPSAPLPLSETLERIPDSSPLRVSSNTLLESGIPPARTREERDTLLELNPALSPLDGSRVIDAALDGVARTEAKLALLVRGLKHLASGAAAARDANVELMHELDELRTHLARSYEEEQVLRFRMHQLEQMLDVIRHETSRERAFLIEQEDLFLVEIMTDHERQIAELRRELSHALARRDDQSALAELTAQRDQAREYASRCERERDLAWHELAQSAPRSEPAVTLRRETPAPTAGGAEPSKSGALPLAAISLRSVSVPAGNGPVTERSSARPSTVYSLSKEDLGE